MKVIMEGFKGRNWGWNMLRKHGYWDKKGECKKCGDVRLKLIILIQTKKDDDWWNKKGLDEGRNGDIIK